MHGVLLGVGIEVPQHGEGSHVLLLEAHDQSLEHMSHCASIIARSMRLTGDRAYAVRSGTSIPAKA